MIANQPLVALYTMILSFSLTPALSWALGENVSFQSTSMEGDTRLITYQYGFNGKRVLHDDDGQASLITLLTLIKQDYFKQSGSYTPPTGAEVFKNWKTYRSAVVANLSRLEEKYNRYGVCNHENSQIRGVCSRLGNLKEKLRQNSVSFNDVFELSNFLQSLESIGITHTYQVDRYNPDGEKLPDQENRAASYMLSTGNLHVWLPDQMSSSRCRDYHSAEDNFVAQLGGGHQLNQPNQTSPGHRGTRVNN